MSSSPQPPVLTLRFDFTGNLWPCRFLDTLAMDSDCPECKHPLNNHGPHPDKRCQTCDGIANLVLIDRRAQCNNTIEVIGDMPENYRVKAVQCSNACSEMHTFVPGCAQFILHSGSLGVDDDTKIQTLDEAIQRGDAGFFRTGPIMGNFDEFRAQYIPPAVPTYEYWEKDRNAMAQADSYATWEPPAKALHEAANILETAPYGRIRMAEWLRQMARRRDMLDAMGEGADQQGLETSQGVGCHAPALSLDDRISQLEEHVYRLLGGTSDHVTALEKRVKELEVYATQRDKFQSLVHRALDEARQAAGGEDSDQNIIRAREKMRELETQLKQYASDFARQHVKAMLAEEIEGRLDELEAHRKADCKVVGNQSMRIDVLEGEVVRSDAWDAFRDRVAKVEDMLRQFDRALSRQYNQKAEIAARVDAIERALDNHGVPVTDD